MAILESLLVPYVIFQKAVCLQTRVQYARIRRHRTGRYLLPREDRNKCYGVELPGLKSIRFAAAMSVEVVGRLPKNVGAVRHRGRDIDLVPESVVVMRDSVWSSGKTQCDLVMKEDVAGRE